MSLFTVICLCYNHELYVEQALHSIFAQTHRPLQVLIADDASQDNSVELIKGFLRQHQDSQIVVQFIENTHNLGNCQSFNQLLALAEGKYLLDFSADDVLYPHAVSACVTFFENQPCNVGAIYANAELINAEGKFLGHYYPPSQIQPSGALYGRLLRAGGLVCTVSMVFRRDLMQELRGYNPALFYEDYDFMLRLAQRADLAYFQATTIRYRQHHQSLSKQFYDPHKNQRLLESTLETLKQQAAYCIKNGFLEDFKQSLRFHFRFCLYTAQPHLASQFRQLHQTYCGRISIFENILCLLYRVKFPLALFYKLYRGLRL
ncbi:MAG: glycosyltransferase [Cytophagales bacterium]|nr:MAG: glycosyltransferase [Cytophagales bacterium]TAF61319.1 MAG: glycosyltransferase [Cytophagales bacterium]